MDESRTRKTTPGDQWLDIGFTLLRRTILRRKRTFLLIRISAILIVTILFFWLLEYFGS